MVWVAPEPALSEQARTILQQLLALMGLAVTVSVRQLDEQRMLLEVRGAESGLVIGRKGATLEALQLVLNKILARRNGGALRQRMIIDSEGYRSRRAEALRVMGRDLVEVLRERGRSLVIYGMRAADRRALHVALAECEAVRTQSDGEGNGRRLRISPLPLERRRSGGGG